MQILDHTTIERKIRRIAFQIIENNYTEEEVFFLGINRNGYTFAELLKNDLAEISSLKVNLCQLTIDPKAPLDSEITLSVDTKDLVGKSIIIVDDVANTGRTIFYAYAPLMDILPKRVEVAVLINRKHKSFPINVDYIGLSLATTLKEDIRVHLEENKYEAILQ